MLTLDLSGLKCPYPILKTKKFLAGVESNTTVKIITTDHDSIKDLADFCRKTGNTMLEQNITETKIITQIQRR